MRCHQSSSAAARSSMRVGAPLSFIRRMLALGLGASLTGGAAGATAVVGSGLDFFNYGNAPAGASPSVPVFAVLNTEDPDRLGSLVLGFQTAGVVPSGLAPSQYAVASVRLVLNLQNSLLYDPTYDAVASYIAGGVDADPGRPFEVYGLGLRHGYAGVGFESGAPGPPLFSEGSPFEPSGGAGTYGQHAFPLSYGDAVLRSDGDVTDSVSEGWETEPFGIGTIQGVVPGTATPTNSRVVFSMNLADPDIRTYFQHGLSVGSIGLNVASLHASDGIGQGSYPRFSARENATETRRPMIEIDYAIVPEPSAVCLLAAGALLAGRRRRDLASAVD